MEAAYTVTRNMALAILAAVLLTLAVAGTTLGLVAMGNSESHHAQPQQHVARIHSGPIGGSRPINPNNQ